MYKVVCIDNVTVRSLNTEDLEQLSEAAKEDHDIRRDLDICNEVDDLQVGK